jgi:hypothetical protein
MLDILLLLLLLLSGWRFQPVPKTSKDKSDDWSVRGIITKKGLTVDMDVVQDLSILTHRIHVWYIC